MTKHAVVVLDHFGVSNFLREETDFKVDNWVKGYNKKYDLMFFTGGEDINPELYGEKPIRGTYFSPRRDEIEIEAYRSAMETGENIIKVGICRGAQLLNVLNGGSLWQNISGHHGGHKATDVRTGLNHYVSSVHHQAMRPASGAQVLAVARLATELANEKTLIKTQHPSSIEIEALWYPSTKSLCFQGHPEFGPKSCSDYFLQLLMEKINELPAKTA